RLFATQPADMAIDEEAVGAPAMPAGDIAERLLVLELPSRRVNGIPALGCVERVHFAAVPGAARDRDRFRRPLNGGQGRGEGDRRAVRELVAYSQWLRRPPASAQDRKVVSVAGSIGRSHLARINPHASLRPVVLGEQLAV